MAMGPQIQIFKVATPGEIHAAFTTFGREHPDALFVSPDPFLGSRRAQFATLAARHAIPSSFSVRQFVEAGGLMSKGTNIVDAFRQAGVYTGQILKGGIRQNRRE